MVKMEKLSANDSPHIKKIRGASRPNELGTSIVTNASETLMGWGYGPRIGPGISAKKAVFRGYFKRKTELPGKSKKAEKGPFSMAGNVNQGLMSLKKLKEIRDYGEKQN